MKGEIITKLFSKKDDTGAFLKVENSDYRVGGGSMLAKGRQILTKEGAKTSHSVEIFWEKSNNLGVARDERVLTD